MIGCFFVSFWRYLHIKSFCAYAHRINRRIFLPLFSLICCACWSFFRPSKIRTVSRIFEKKQKKKNWIPNTNRSKLFFENLLRCTHIIQNYWNQNVELGEEAEQVIHFLEREIAGPFHRREKGTWALSLRRHRRGEWLLRDANRWPYWTPD